MNREPPFPAGTGAAREGEAPAVGTRESALCLFCNRELSWLEFNRRVLRQAVEAHHPLAEQLHFISIVSSNFDEFFMIRVAELRRQVRAGDRSDDPCGLPLSVQLALIAFRVREIIRAQSDCVLQVLLPALERQGVRLLRPEQYTSAQRRELERLFESEMYPLLTPVAIDPEGRFPLPGNLRMYLGFRLSPAADGRAADGRPGEAALRLAISPGGDLRSGRAYTPAEPPAGILSSGRADADRRIAVIGRPPGTPRLIRLPAQGARREFALWEDVVLQHAARFFPGGRIEEAGVFRVTRDADLSVDESRDEGFLKALQETLSARERNVPVRLEAEGGGESLRAALRGTLHLEETDVYRPGWPLDLTFIDELAAPLLEGGAGSPEPRPRRRPRWSTQRPLDLAGKARVIEALREQDLLLVHPYESFDPVIRLVREAASDPAVLAIKMTLYRTSGGSPILKALLEAARRGRQVTVVVELKARFDEENNIGWAQELEQGGVTVIYGLVGLKVHAKALLITRRGPDGIRHYFHLGTGNYNEDTARHYTDVSFLSSRADLARDLILFFHAVTGYAPAPDLRKLVMSPAALRERLLGLIRREAQHSLAGRPGLILAKMNALSDPRLIHALYRASRAGVQVRLNVRGICCLRPGIAGLSENIRVVSIVDHFLEHGRILYFRNGGEEEVYLSSADWMPRNLDRRVELMVPIEGEEHRRRLIDVLQIPFLDNRSAHELQPDGNYEKIEPEEGAPPLRSQEYFQRQAERNARRGRIRPLHPLRERRKSSAGR
jgi:polyphosphate kinase